VRELVIPFIKAADEAAAQKQTGTTYRAASGEERNVLVDYLKPADLVARLKLSLPEGEKGKEGLLDTIDKVLKFSVNTWDQGFMDKLFSTNTPVSLGSSF
jgi:glutamate decarboxylase